MIFNLSNIPNIQCPKPVRLVVIDVDGVLCKGKTYDKNGDCVSKSFVDTDFTAIKRFRALGIPVVAITGDAWNEGFLKKRNIPYFISRQDDRHVSKEEFLPLILEQFKVELDDVIYIGDDLFDISIMEKLGRENSFCPIDSPNIVRDHCNEKYPIFVDGGCLATLFDMLEANNRIPKVPFHEIFPKILALDKHDKF